jgi:DNA invertase Pin-like site-specific DNA recombinase
MDFVQNRHDGKRLHKASDFFRDVFDLKPEGVSTVVIYCRVSARNQAEKGNLLNQRRHLEKRLAEIGIDALLRVCERNSGRRSPWDRPGLVKAKKLADRFGVPLVALCRNRFQRGPNANDDANTDTVSQDQWEEWAEFSEGVTFATYLYPDATPREQKTCLMDVARGEGRHIGRPRKIDRDIIQRAIGWHRRGVPKREIARRLNRRDSTIRRWI